MPLMVILPNIPDSLSNAYVCDLVGADGNWNWHMMDWVPDEVKAMIGNILPANASYGDDSLCIATEENGSFSVSTMYRYLMHTSEYECNNLWNHVWKLRVPERIKSFIWILSHDRIFTNKRRNVCGLGSAECSLCGHIYESSLHAMRDCKAVKEVWQQLIPSNISNAFFHYDLKDCIQLNLNDAAHRGSDWCNLWAIGCHTFWSWRNKEIHVPDYKRPLHGYKIILDKCTEYSTIMLARNKIMMKVQQEQMVSWQRPKPGFVKLNMDGARDKNGMTGCGGILRDDMGNWLLGFVKSTGYGSVLSAECWGTYEGIKLSLQAGYQNVEVHTDSKQAVEIIKNKDWKRKGNSQLVIQIKNVLSRCAQFELTHTYREANSCANVLAKLGKDTQGGLVVFNEISPFLFNSFENDLRGASSSRMIAL